MNGIAITFWSYTLVVFAIGLISVYYSRNTKKDFFLADRGLGAWVAGLSGAASVESGWVTMGLVGSGFKNGIGVYWVVPATALSFAFIWFVIAPRLGKLATEQNSVTMTDVLAGGNGSGLSRWIRLLSVSISVGMLTLYVAAQLKSAGDLFQAAFDWQFSVGVLAGLAIALVYTITGGFRAVAWTDVVQAALMIFAMVIVPFLLVQQLGGPSVFWQKVSEVPVEGYDQWTAGKSGLALFAFLTLYLGIPLGNLGQPHLAVRLMAARDSRAIFRGGMISVAWVTILFSGAVTLGIAAKLLVENQRLAPFENPEHSLMMIATSGQLVPGWLGGLMVAAALAAICSTVDSQLLVAASNVSSDLVDNPMVLGTQQRSERFIWWADRITVALVAVIAMGFGLSNQQSIFDFVLNYGFAGLGAAFGPALFFRLLRPNADGNAAVFASMLAGLATVVVWNLWDLKAYSYNLPPAVLMATVAGAAFIRRSPQPDPV